MTSRGDAPCTILTAASALMEAEAAASEAHDRLVELFATWCDPHECRALAAAAAEAGKIGMPPVPFNDAVREAECWAAFVSETELAAYAWAAARRLPAHRRERFVQALSELSRDAA